MKTLIIVILILLCLLTTPLSLKRMYDNKRVMEKRKQEEASEDAGCVLSHKDDEI